MYSATISARDSKGIIEKCFASEDKAIKDKAKYTVTKHGNKVLFEIHANDSIGLRTVLNSITKMLTVIEKMDKIK